MIELNLDRILNGTLHKRLLNGYEKLKEVGLTEESAREFQSLYTNEDLDKVLNESAIIIKEPIYGLPFIESVMTNKKVPLTAFPIVLESFNEYLEDHEDNMSDEQKSMYENALNEIDEVYQSRYHECILAESATEAEKDLANKLCNKLYVETEEEAVEAVLDNFFESPDVSEKQKLTYGYYLLPSTDPNRLSRMLRRDLIMTESENMEDYSERISSNVISSYLLEDTAIINDVKKIPNVNLANVIAESVEANYRSIFDDIFNEYVPSSEDFYTSPESAMTHLFEDERFYEDMQDEYSKTRVANASRAKALMEAMNDILYTEYTMTSVEDQDPVKSRLFTSLFGRDDINYKEFLEYFAEQINSYEDVCSVMSESTEDESFFEYTRRGEATPVIRKSAGNIREEPFQVNSNRGQKTSSGDDTEDEEDDDDDEVNEEPKKKEKESSNKKEEEKSSEEKEDKTPEESSNKKPVKQKESLTRKIQNKAIDADVKMQKGMSKAQQAGKELKNAAKAVLRIPGNIIKSLKTGIEEWNTMDENKRKEKIMQPGYRTQIFKHLRTALIYGAIWQYKKYMVIVAFICKHTLLHPLVKMNSERNKRLRNELTKELETEIQVTEEKIQDANANGDQKQKYELIRIKNKLEAEKVRVNANSKYI